MQELSYLVALQKKFHYELGFLPREALASKIERGAVWLARENGEPAGYLCHGSFARPEIRIFQAAIQYDARRRHLGLSLVADLVARARQAGAAGISLRCLNDLDANGFWRAAGFRHSATEPGAKAPLNVWTLRLGAGHRFASRIHPCPGCGRTTTDTWTRGARRWSLCPTCVESAIHN